MVVSSGAFVVVSCFAAVVITLAAVVVVAAGVVSAGGLSCLEHAAMPSNNAITVK